MAGAVGPLPVKVNFSGIDLFEPADAPRKGAFSGAAHACKNCQLADGDINIHVFEVMVANTSKVN